jgi:archaellum component FlaC
MNLKRVHAGNEIDEPNFLELRDVYSSRPSQIEEEMNRYGEIMHDVKKLEEYESEKRKVQIKILQQIERLEAAAVPPKPTVEVAAPKKETLPPSVAKATSEEDRLREEIQREIAEIEKAALPKAKIHEAKSSNKSSQAKPNAKFSTNYCHKYGS